MTISENVPTEELEAAVTETFRSKETQRRMEPIIDHLGLSAPMIVEWIGARGQTIYRWFDRLGKGTERPRSSRPQGPN
jgi:hypothetical protein